MLNIQYQMNLDHIVLMIVLQQVSQYYKVNNVPYNVMKAMIIFKTVNVL